MSAPILFLVFNRPEVTRRVFETVRMARPERLYVACDGPRPRVDGEADRCQEVRAIATAVDWPCELKTLFRDQNLGCKRAVSGAISWFFEQEEEGIILEDDCLPGEDFFSFCAEMLARYRDDDRVWCVTGDNFQGGRSRGDAAYYFSKYAHIWGWATWRKAWRHYEPDMLFWPEWRKSSEWKQTSRSMHERWYWGRTFDRAYRGEIDTWDYAWLACIWRHGGLTATPNANLVENIGIGVGGTHMTEPDDKLSIVVQPIGDLDRFPECTVCSEADDYVFQSIFYQHPIAMLRKSPAYLWREFRKRWIAGKVASG